MLTWHQHPLCFLFQPISLIVSGNCNNLWTGTTQWIIILGTRLPLLCNTTRSFWSIWRTSNVPNFDKGLSYNLKTFWEPISSPRQRLLDLVICLLIDTICPAMIRNTELIKACLKWHPDDVITQQTYWLPDDSISIHRMNHKRTGGKLIQISMTTTPTPFRLAVHWDFQISRTSGANKRQCTDIVLISAMWHEMKSLSYYMVSEWRPVFHWCETLSARDYLKAQLRSIRKESL